MIDGHVYTKVGCKVIKITHQRLFASTWITVRDNVEPKSQSWKTTYDMIIFVSSSQTCTDKLHMQYTLITYKLFFIEIHLCINCTYTYDIWIPTDI